MAAAPTPDFILALEGFEGPIDLLLNLAREQKVDLTKISVLKLAEQYLAYLERARELQLELAADYLVMAAWLAYLKSRLLLPDLAEPDEPDASDLADQLARRLQRLDAIRRAADALFERPQLGLHRHGRRAPEGVAIAWQSRFACRLHDLLEAYLQHHLRANDHALVLTPAAVMRVEEAIKRITGLLFGGEVRSPDWRSLWAYLPEHFTDERSRRAAIASSFAASLELARNGVLELRQGSAFGPILVRPKSP